MNFKSLLSATMLSVLTVASLQAPANAFDQAQKDEIGKLVHDYLVEHPEVIFEMQDVLRKRQAEERAAQIQPTINANHDLIFNAKYDIALGNPNGKVTIVEFFDYNCGFCKHAINDMDAIIKANPEVRFVLKEFPVLGPDSDAAHMVSRAFRQLAPEKYGEFHRQLLTGKHANEERAIEIAGTLGVSEAALREKMKSNPDEDSIRETRDLAEKLGVTGTPSYVLGNEAIIGAVGAEALYAKIASVEQCGKTSC